VRHLFVDGKRSGGGEAVTRHAPAACTIIFKNYLSHARILAESFARHVPGGRFYVLVMDGLPNGAHAGRNVQVVKPTDLELPYLFDLCFKYDVTELSTAVKPSLLSLLLNRYGEERVAYFDPDILIMRPLDELWKTWSSAGIVLTPHLLKPIPLDGLKPSEQDIMLSGAYNLGFIGVKRATETNEFLQWWAERLRDHCRIDHTRALFTDQRWIDLVPGYFPSTAILRDPTYNVAYWNLHERTLQQRARRFLINGKPLAFFHFSGFDPAKPNVLSRHQTRTEVKVGSPLAHILARYADLQMKHGHSQSRTWKTGYMEFSNGVRVHSLLRQLYLKLDEKARSGFGNPFDSERDASFLEWATVPRPEGHLSPFVESIYQYRYDVAAAFPKVPGEDTSKLIHWASTTGAAELGYDPRLVRNGSNGSSIKAAAAAAPATPGKTEYIRVVERIRAIVDTALPAKSTVLVVSKGDHQLVALGKRRASHFPQNGHRMYAGYNPADSATAIAHLEALREKGAEFLVFPQSAFWWLAHYADFRQHLQERYRIAVLEPDACLIFALRESPGKDSSYIQRVSELDRILQPVESQNVNEPPVAVNVAGYIASEKGVGEGVRSDIRCLQAAGVPVVLNNVVDSGSANCDRTFEEVSDTNPHPINLIHVNADQVREFAQHRGEKYFAGRYNIGYWAWELADFPREWETSFKYFQEVWVPSNFTMDAIARVSPIPVVRMPHCVVPAVAKTKAETNRFELARGKFVFLFMFDFHSFTERKNPPAVVRAFKKAFSRRDDALLVLKCSHAESAPAELAHLKRMAENANIRFLDAVLDRSEVDALMSRCDCYVSLHRSEGFGLTLAEAMNLGKPVIGTAYSGNMDFMTPANSYLVRYKLIELDRDHGPYRKGCVWADADIDHAAELMRAVYENPDEAREIGRKGQHDVRRDFSPQAVGRMLKARLGRVANAIPAAPVAEPAAVVPVASPPSVTVSAEDNAAAEKAAEYQELKRQILDVVQTNLPAAAKVIVASRGDDELLRLGGRRGWHYPQTPDGTYAGHHPTDSRDAIAHLEALKAGGGRYLLLPATAFWWMDHYGEFRRHLESRYRKVVERDGVCAIFSLRESPAGRRPQTAPPFEQVRYAVRIALPRKARLLVMGAPDGLLQLEGRSAYEFPEDPANDLTSILQLEDARTRGIQFLVLCGPGIAALEDCQGLQRHLETCYPRIWEDRWCVIYQLARKSGDPFEIVHDRLDYLTDVLQQLKTRHSEPAVAAPLPDERLAEVDTRVASINNRFAARPYINRDIFNATGDLRKPMGYSAEDLTIPTDFSDIFRGAEDFVASRQRVYLGFFEGKKSVVDLGCGRGEFLRLLAEMNIQGRGVDVDRALVQRLQAEGLDVIEAEAVDFIRRQPEGSLDAIFSAQFIEHLESSQLTELLALARSRLSAGGVFIAETVNPECFEALKTFHVDPTHRAPIYPQVLLYLCLEAGFRAAKIFYPLGGGFTQLHYEKVGEYAVVAEV
jgi:glycosyltransferase involved in cell wall biosynthesis/2-polyprenyl-3-methyl-5-hydroxy-6-metoxy-1,4-benzoquinol methylase